MPVGSGNPMAASLWESAGRPPLQGRLPLAHTTAWATARAGIQRALGNTGCPARFRSPQALWDILHATPLPPAPTWALLLADLTVDDLAQAAQESNQHRTCDVVAWNARWLVRTDTSTAGAKRNIVLRCLDQRNIVVLQETHWTEQTQALWETLFPGTQVVATNARPGPKGGPQGGVAILVPHPYDIVEQRVIVQGCAVEADVRLKATDSETFTIRGVYLPPDSRRETLADLTNHPPFPCRRNWRSEHATSRTPQRR